MDFFSHSAFSIAPVVTLFERRHFFHRCGLIFGPNIPIGFQATGEREKKTQLILNYNENGKLSVLDCIKFCGVASLLGGYRNPQAYYGHRVNQNFMHR